MRESSAYTIGESVTYEIEQPKKDTHDEDDDDDDDEAKYRDWSGWVRRRL